MPHPRRLRGVLDRVVEIGESRRGPFDPRRLRPRAVTFSLVPAERSFSPAPRSARRTIVGAAAALILLAAVGLLSTNAITPSSQIDLVHSILPVADELPISNGSAGGATVPDSGTGAGLVPASSQASPTPSSVADGAPLRAHEVFGFAPYWTLAQSSQFDLKGLTTVAYFSVGANGDGSIDESGAGWEGFNSQNLVDLTNQAHAAGDRVVLTVNDFSQSSLDQLTSSAAAAKTLSDNILVMIGMKHLDGVNLDLEGEGSADQAGLTSLVSTVSSTLHAVNPNYQVTMDTYASSAADPSGFYNIPALSHAVNGFFVMAYQLNLNATANSGSPMTSAMYSNQETAQQYAAAAPGSKVILGLPFYGYDWPTTNGTLSAQPEGAPTVVTYAQEATSGNPIYWDADTDTAWTSYQVAGQWHEAFFEDPNSLYLAARMAVNNGLGGVGIWALGMDGSNDAAMVSALDGDAPAEKDALAGPTSTSSSSLSSGNTGPSPASPGGQTTPTGGAPAPATPSSPTTPGSSPAPSPSPSTSTPTTLPLIYQGDWQGTPVNLTSSAMPAGTLSVVGTLTGFVTDDTNDSCLSGEPTLNVYAASSDSANFYVITQTPGDCTDSVLTFAIPKAQTRTTDPP